MDFATLVSILGKGGMGDVRRVDHSDRQVAVKTLHQDLVNSPLSVLRFLVEAEIQRAAAHASPGVPRVYDVYEGGGGEAPSITMELIEGVDLWTWLRKGSLPSYAEIGRVIREVAAILADVHAVGIVHRDVKPENIMVEEDGGRVFLIDFGIARSEESKVLDCEDTMLGTMQYMAPEQARTPFVDGKADVYALGGVLFFAIVGLMPAEYCGWGGNRVSKRELPANTRPEHLRALCEWMMQDAPEDRPSAREVVEYLTDWETGDTPIRVIGTTENAMSLSSMSGGYPFGGQSLASRYGWSSYYVPADQSDQPDREKRRKVREFFECSAQELSRLSAAEVEELVLLIG